MNRTSRRGRRTDDRRRRRRRGYLSRPELTAEKFIPDCFSGQTGARLYRTGDLARYLPDGNIEFLGRMDHQVKVRGHRIELGEIEAVLSRHAGVRQAVVLAREDAPGEKRLVAYLMVADGAEVNVSELRRYLKEQLPEYLIPAAYVTLTEMPLTANGKVDRRGVGRPSRAGRSWSASTSRRGRRWKSSYGRSGAKCCEWNESEFMTTSSSWAGDSILTIQIISRARQAGLNLSPAELFTHPTIAELSEIVGQTRKLLETGGEVPLTPIQQWFFDQNLPEQHHQPGGAARRSGRHGSGADQESDRRAVYETRCPALRFINNDGLAAADCQRQQ